MERVYRMRHVVLPPHKSVYELLDEEELDEEEFNRAVNSFRRQGWKEVVINGLPQFMMDDDDGHFKIFFD